MEKWRLGRWWAIWLAIGLADHESEHASRPDMPTLLLSRSQVERLLDPSTLATQLRAGFITYSKSSAERALRVRAPIPDHRGTATVLFPGVLPGLSVYTVKVHAKYPDQDPAIRGVICLHEASTGTLLAIMDSTHITAIRTGIAGALAADTLARGDASTVAVIGAGVQGSFQLRALAAMRRLHGVTVYDTDRDRAAVFATRMGEELSLPIAPAADLVGAIAGADIVLAATWSTIPFILPGMLRSGTHVTTLGADEPGKAEVSADLIGSSLFVCDDRQLTVEMGALRGVGLAAEVIGAELGEVLGGTHPGRTSEEQVTIYAAVGLAFQDAIAAWHVYEQAVSVDPGAYPTIDWLA
jgi:ornithine cyclodeaminase/alanine dehydrogenase-like protein (mu-crystallin family)